GPEVRAERYPSAHESPRFPRSPIGVEWEESDARAQRAIRESGSDQTWSDAAGLANVASSSSHISSRWRRRARTSRGVPGLAREHRSIIAIASQPSESRRDAKAASPCSASSGRAASAREEKSEWRPTRRNQ